MPQLPGRPDLDQLRHQAHDLRRAAAGGDSAALRRLRAVSDRVTLSAAQLAIAREYGHPSWARLKAEVERRARSRAAGSPAERPAGAPQSWRQMREWSAGLLRERTGDDVATWNERIRASGIGDEPALRSWLAERRVTGYAQALLVWESFGYPGFMTADGDELIAAQYADRPQLRPILEAVLAAVADFGPVTVQARKTFVSLVTPRRTFAVVQATTKKRVDLGLRLDGAQPAGRLKAARDIGAANLRVELGSPAGFDDEALAWLRRAYDENVAPAPPRRPARRPARKIGVLTVVIEGFDLPGRSCRPEPDGTGHSNVHVGLGSRDKNRPGLVVVPDRPWRAAEPVPGDAPSARWEVPVTLRRDEAGFDFTGPDVDGDRANRNLGLAWGDVPGDGTLRLFRGAGLRLVDVDPGLIEEAMRPGWRLVARVRLTDAKGNPVCARVRPPALSWSAAPGE